MPWWMEYCPVRIVARVGEELVENTPKLKSAPGWQRRRYLGRVTHRHAAAVKANIHPAHISSKKTTTFGFLPVFFSSSASSAGFLCLVQDAASPASCCRHSGRRFNQILVWVIVSGKAFRAVAVDGVSAALAMSGRAAAQPQQEVWVKTKIPCKMLRFLSSKC